MNKKSFVIMSILVFVFTLNLTAASIQTEQLSREERIRRNEQAAGNEPDCADSRTLAEAVYPVVRRLYCVVRAPDAGRRVLGRCGDRLCAGAADPGPGAEDGPDGG